MIRRFLAAHTDASNPYPPYISINETEDGGVSVAIREPAVRCGAGHPESGPCAGIVLRRGVAIRLLEEALAKLRDPR